MIEVRGESPVLHSHTAQYFLEQAAAVAATEPTETVVIERPQSRIITLTELHDSDRNSGLEIADASAIALFHFRRYETEPLQFPIKAEVIRELGSFVGRHDFLVRTIVAQRQTDTEMLSLDIVGAINPRDNEAVAYFMDTYHILPRPKRPSTLTKYEITLPDSGYPVRMQPYKVQ